MTILQLNYMNELARTKSFSLAARNLEISQPAMSMQIAKLEEELEIKLFHRAASKVLLTREGEKFLEKGREVLMLFDKLKDFTVELEHRPSGMLNVGVIPTLAPYWIPMFIGKFVKEFPQIQVRITEMKTHEIINALKIGSIEAGFLSTPVETTGIDFYALFYERFYVYVSQKHSLFADNEILLESINMDDVLYLEEGNCFQNQVNSVCYFNKQTESEPGSWQYRSNSIESLCRIVELGQGMTFIPELATMSVSAEQEDMIKTIAPPVPVREISLATSHHQQGNFLVDLLVAEAMKSIPQRMKVVPLSNPLPTQLSV